VWGLTADASYKSVLNEGTCASANPSVFYQSKLSIEPEINIDSYGMGMGHVIAPFAVREASLSLAIKEVGSDATIACADLNSSQGLKGVNGYGKSYFYNWVGYVSANDKGRSVAEIVPAGWPTMSAPLKATASKTSCFETPVHYLQDATGADAAANTLQINSDMLAGAAWASNLFKARLNEIKSLAIDATEEMYYPCIDLTTKILMFRSGSFKPTEAGVALYGTLAGRAILETSKEGATTASVVMTGLKASTTYSNHVHNGTCANAGGDHYLHEISGSDNAVNGMFPVFTTDAAGRVRYTLTANKIVRPDARSIVIHEPGTGVKIACADLE
jgi:Cu/Zn superoxide dismutase